MSKLVEKVVGELSEKRRWREYKARVRALPVGHRRAAEGVERYLLATGGITDSRLLVEMVNNLVSVFGAAASMKVPVRDVVGQDPQRFADGFLADGAGSRWVGREPQRLVRRIAASSKVGDRA